MKPRTAAFAFIFLAVVLDMLALGLMVPVLPKLVVEFEGGDHSKAAQITGVFGFWWAFMQFVASPILGSLSDRFGRRPVLLLSSLGLGLDYIAMALAPNLRWLFVGRVVSGITAATFASASAYIADITPKEQRASRYGMLGAAFGIGFIVGPALGGLLGKVDLRLPFWVAAAFCLVNTLYGWFILPESLPPERRQPFRWNVANPWGALRLLLKPGQSSFSAWAMSALIASAFLNYLAHESLPSMFVLYTDYRFGWDEGTVGLVLGGVGLCTMVVAAGLTRVVVARIGEASTLRLGILCGLIGFACYGYAEQASLFLIGVPFIALLGLSGPALQALLSAGVDPTRQGQLQGALSSLRGVAGMVGPLLFTQAFSWATASPGRLVGLPYYLAAAQLLLGLLLVMPIRKPPLNR